MCVCVYIYILLYILSFFVDKGRHMVRGRERSFELKRVAVRDRRMLTEAVCTCKLAKEFK